jgi:hypothetical protein
VICGEHLFSAWDFEYTGITSDVIMLPSSVLSEVLEVATANILPLLPGVVTIILSYLYHVCVSVPSL